MPKVSIAQLADATPCVPEALSGGETLALLGRDKDPIHLLAHRLKAGETLAIAPAAVDRLLYVWTGAVTAGGTALPAGSSLIVEHGADQTLRADADSLLLSFAAATPPAAPRRGGQVHLLPDDHVPRFSAPGAAGATGGGLHADGGCPGCGLWLHENSFAPMPDEMTPEQLARGIHSHEEDEVIFVTDGSIRLGRRLYPAGTALAVAANTLYGFTAGPEGARFINFRAGRPRDIHFAGGTTMDEVGYWRDRVPAPRYVDA